MNQTTMTPAEETAVPAEPLAGKPSLLERLERWRPLVAYQGLSLGLICALVALILLVANALTQGTIAEQQMADRLAVLRQVLPEALYDNNPLADGFKVQDAELGEIEVFPARLQGKLTAVVFQGSNIGYGGPIEQMMAVDAQGRILGVRVLAHKETPGLADKIEASRSDWIKVFDGLSLDNTALDKWKVKKDGGQFDQFAGATITPRAVVKTVLQGLQFQARHAEQLKAE
ncbi:electron transport complex subunit RsxG [Azotobacter chroococcum]|uniref:Ion-translocating oxidoreductase complex subunit G n=2 Tax=Azotobacter chroococcum TaxID=353 RepID=A0A0C4WKJ1_9GAMM|nr:electron transport complex subunit RsxG [Azotobacter chroococcum]AJE23323.1 Electron transport complex, RnfABCDGE type, G subunit [Azotobacter chroococcum NCIMB 8003]QQE88709.1 electron transport complex subunit RsxG [Azotobacter chroococcum]